MEGMVVGGKYRLLRQIGAGGMAVVWEAEHVQIGRKLAVKLLQGQLSANPEAVLRFEREAQIAGTLGHDHICPVIDLGKTEVGQHYLVMELLRGRSLAETLRASGTLAIDRALDIAAQILDAMGAAHSAGVVHRDLKPENIFLSQMGGRDDFVRILDFGISKMTVDGGPEATKLTRTGIVMGTPHYMAPEQARGQSDLDSRVDLYATGAILYEMLTGRLAYDGASINEVIIKIATEPFIPPRAHRPDLPESVDAIVVRAMGRRREDRFATAGEMREAVLRAKSLLTVVDDGPRLVSVATPSSLVVAGGSSPPLASNEPAASLSTEASTPAVASGRGAGRVRVVSADISSAPVPGMTFASGSWRLPRSRLPLIAAALVLVAAATTVIVWLTSGRDDEGGAAQPRAAVTVSRPPDPVPAAPVAAEHTPPPPTTRRAPAARAPG